MPITLLDGIVLGVALFSAVLAMVRGFSREVLSVASWAGSAYAAYKLYPFVLPYAQQYTSSKTVALAGSAGVVFLVALIVLSYITMKIADFIIDSRIGALDRTLGFVFGAARGILIVVVAMMFFNWLVEPTKRPDWVSNAKAKPLIDNLGNRLIAMMPDNIDATLLDRLKGVMPQKAGEEAPDDAPANDEGAAPDNAAPANSKAPDTTKAPKKTGTNG
jgi:membrane protein required for colicin V production